MTNKEPAFPGGGPAFPIVDLDLTHPEAAKYMGLTKREIYAAMAMQGLLGSSQTHLDLRGKEGHPSKIVSRWARSFADALIAELEKE